MAERELTLAERRVLAYQSVFLSPAGQDVLADMKKSLGGPSYKPGSDALQMAYREGRRSVLLDILATVEAGEWLADNLTTKVDQPAARGSDPAQQAEADTGDIWDTRSHLE